MATSVSTLRETLMKTKAHKLVRFPGIVRDAKRLQCSRVHLYLVLSGKRTSHRLLVRYRALRKERAA